MGHSFGSDLGSLCLRCQLESHWRGHVLFPPGSCDSRGHFCPQLLSRLAGAVRLGPASGSQSLIGGSRTPPTRGGVGSPGAEMGCGSSFGSAVITSRRFGFPLSRVVPPRLWISDRCPVLEAQGFPTNVWGNLVKPPLRHCCISVVL